jgi:hypothetical protein
MWDGDKPAQKRFEAVEFTRVILAGSRREIGHKNPQK